MAILFQCNCGQKYSIKEELAGKKTSCKVCGKILRIPDVVKSTRTKSKPVQPEPDEDVWDDDFEELDFLVPPKKRKSSDLPSSKKSKTGGKKRKDAEPDSESGGVSTGLIIAMVAGAAAVFIGGIVFLVMNMKGGAGIQAVADVGEVAEPEGGGGGAAAPALPKLKEVRNDLAGFAINFPDGWEVRTGGGSGGIPPFASARNGSILLSVKADPHATVLFTNNINVTEGAPNLEDHPVHSAHRLVKMKIEAEYDSYEETEPKRITSAFGEGRVCTFTAKEGFFSTSKGLRATYLSSAWCLKVICKCPSGEFAENEAMFRSVIESFKN